MSDKRRYVEDLVAGKFDLHGTGAPPGLASAFDAVPGDDADVTRPADEVLARVGADAAAIRADLARDPDAVVARFRAFFHDPDLDRADVVAWLDAWTLAAADPDRFKDELDRPPTEFGLRDWVDHLRAYVHEPDAESDAQQRTIAGLRDRYRVPSVEINPNLRQFETWDPWWVPLASAKLKEGAGTWPDLQPFRQHDADHSFVYDYQSLDYGADGLHIGLVSDFGTGYYHSWGIAEQLAAWRFPLVFHLGDVYYAGRAQEFDRYYAKPLEEVTAVSTLFSMPENHELYSGGRFWLRYIDVLRGARRTPQEASYFCVRLRHHQIIAIDVNWLGRQKFVEDAPREWLAARLAEAGGRTNILLTGSAPYSYGEDGPRALLEDLEPFTRGGRIGLWFWGDDHYCALFERDATRAPFIGSCIGHGGFPGKRQRAGEASWASVAWLEDAPRFPGFTHLRDDMSNNGWCDLTLRSDGGVDLLYVDWLACKRCRLSTYRAPDGHLEALAPQQFADRDRDDVVPELHRPPGT